MSSNNSSSGGSSSPWATSSSSIGQSAASSAGGSAGNQEKDQFGRRKKSLTLQAMGAKMISEGRSPADLTLEDLKLLDPMSLPPKLRVKVQPAHPLYERESASYGKQKPNEFQQPPKVCFFVCC